MSRIPIQRLGVWNLGQFPGTRSILCLKMSIFKLLPRQFTFFSVVSKGNPSQTAPCSCSLSLRHTHSIASLSLGDLPRVVDCLPLCLLALPWECSWICILLWYERHGRGTGSFPEKVVVSVSLECGRSQWSPGKRDFDRPVDRKTGGGTFPLGCWLLKRSTFESRYLVTGQEQACLPQSLSGMKLSLADPIAQAKKHKPCPVPQRNPFFQSQLSSSVTLQIEVTVT